MARLSLRTIAACAVVFLVRPNSAPAVDAVPSAKQVVEDASDLVRRAKTLRVTEDLEVTSNAAAAAYDSRSVTSYALALPNRLRLERSMTTSGVTLEMQHICDGTRLLTRFPRALSRELIEPGPANFDAMRSEEGKEVFVFSLAGDYSALSLFGCDGSEETKFVPNGALEYVATEELEGIPVHHVKVMIQEDGCRGEWHAWIQAVESPLLLQIQSRFEFSQEPASGNRVDAVGEPTVSNLRVRYSGWKINEEMPGDRFALTLQVMDVSTRTCFDAVKNPLAQALADGIRPYVE